MIAAITALVLIYGSLWPSGSGYVFQELSVCGIKNDKPENITFMYYFTFNRQLLLYYDNDDKQFSECTNCIPELWQFANYVTELLNKNPKWLNQVKREEERCKLEVKTFWNKTVERKVKPSVEVFLPVQVRSDDSPLLVCYVWGFYPAQISVAWFKNDILVKNYTEAVSTGEWTYSVVATLDMRNSLPEDNYTCLVYFPSLDLTITKNWKPGLTDIQIIKISVASVVFALGLVFLITGITLWMNAKRSGYSPIPGVDFQ